jgi:DNA-binding winged helix-turn-helix (wHTH) protein/tetratricopeptide (TPR) repeat protein
MARPLPPPFRLGEFLVEPRRNRISRSGAPQRLQPKTMELLVYLARQDGDVVGLDKIHDDLWVGRYVTDSSVYNAIAQLREALGSDSIETVPRRGYRLTLAVNWLPQTGAAPGWRGWWGATLAAMAVIAIAASLWLSGNRLHDSDAEPAALVVLPITVLGGTENDLLAFGIHSQLLTLLAGVGELRVLAGTTVAALARDASTDADIAAVIGPAHVIRSELQTSGNQLRLNVFLTTATSSELLWAGQYERDLTAGALFSLQSDLATRIATEMRAMLSGPQQNHFANVPTQSFEAWESLVIGQRRTEERTVESLLAALDWFRKAIQLDPGYAEAHARLASSAIMLLDYGDRWNDTALIDEARTAAERALALAPTLVEAHKSMALVHVIADERQAATASLRRALEIAPADATLHHLYARVLTGNGRYDDALDHSLRAVTLDPLSANIHNSLGMTYSALGRYDEAIARFRKALELDPSYLISHSQLCNVYQAGLGRLDLAIQSCLDMLALDPQSVFTMVRIADAYHDLGDHQEAQHWGDRVFAAAPHRVSRQMLVYDNREGFVASFDAWRDREEPLATEPFQIADYLCDAGRHDDARLLLTRFYPEWYEAETPRIVWRNDWDAVRIAFTLQHTGDTERADILLRKVLDYFAGATRTGVQGYGFLDILVLSTLGETDLAIAAYAELYRTGSYAGFWRIRERFGQWAAIADEPRFARISGLIQQDLDAQLRSINAMRERVPAARSLPEEQ